MILNTYSGDEQPVQDLNAQGISVPTHYSFLGSDDNDIIYDYLKKDFEKHGISVVAGKKGISQNKIDEFSTLCNKIVEDLNKGKKVEAQKELDSILV
jgi:hypothetical protein